MTSHGWEAGIEQRSVLGGRHPLGWSVHPRTLVPLGRFTPSPTKAPLDTENALQRRAAEIIGLPPELGDGSAFTTFSADAATVLTTVPDRAIQPFPLPEPPVTTAEPPEPISRDVPETLPTATAPIDLPSGSSTVSAEPAPTETFPQPVQRQPLGRSQPLGFQKPELSTTQASLTDQPDPSPSVASEPPPQTGTPSPPKRPVSFQPAAPPDPDAVGPAAVIDSDAFSQPVPAPETVLAVEESTKTALPSEAASPVEPVQSRDVQLSPSTDSTEAVPPAVAPTATPDSGQTAPPSPTRSQTSARGDIIHRQPLELPSQTTDIPDSTDKVQIPSTLRSEENGLGVEGLETTTSSLQPSTDLQDAPGESPIAPDPAVSEPVQPRPQPSVPIQEAPQPPDAQPLPEQDSPRGVETQTAEKLPSPQRQRLGTVQSNAETVTTPVEVTPIQPVAPSVISPQTDPAIPDAPEQLIAQAATSPQADVSTPEPSPSAPKSLSPKTSPDQPAASVVAETPIRDGRKHQITGSEWEREKGEQEQPTLPTVHRVPLGQTAPTPIVPLTGSADVDLSGLSTVSPEPTLPKVAQAGDTKSFPTPIEKTDSIQKKAVPLLHQLEAQQSEIPEGPETDSETAPEPWTDRFDLEPSQSKTTGSFLPPGETVLPLIKDIGEEIEETAAIGPPSEPDRVSQAPDGVTVVSPLATQQTSSDEKLLEDLAQIMYGQVRSHLHQLHESRHGRAIPPAAPTSIGTAVWPLPLHQLATVVRQQVESRLRSDLERRPIHHR
ncbi:MAG: hypothetical protein AAF282_14115 [Cyanobacteria bacterium P01_A01_bin.15]